MSGFKFGGNLFGSQATTTASTGTSGFSFGSTTSKPTTGFTFGQATTAAPAATGFQLGSSTAAGGLGGFQLGQSTSNSATSASTTTSAAPASGFSFGGAGFGAASTPATTASGGAKPAGGFSFGTPASSTATATQPSTGLTLGAKPGGFSFASVPATSGSPAPASGSLLGGAKPAVTSSSLGFSLSGGLGATKPAATTATPAPSAAAASTAAVGLTLSGALSAGAVSKPSTTGGGFLLGSSASAPTAGGLTIKTGTTAVTTSSVSSGATATTTAAASTANTAAASAGPSMTYKELEDQMNKWWVELESQEKVFLEQATRVNAWDKILVENGQKITALNTDVENVKVDQRQLNHELDFIVAQQKELEEMLGPLEESVAKLPSINYQQHTDTERERTYQIAENIDAQLKRMTEDLKEVIDHLNVGTGSQDKNDPMLQISKILNAHMESLQWIDQSAATLQSRMEQVAKHADYTRKEHERNLRLAYN